MRPVEETWYATTGDIPPRSADARCWTFSTDPEEAGWCTDGGYEGYGVTRERAQLAACAPEMARMLLALEWSGFSAGWNGAEEVPCRSCPSCNGLQDDGHRDECALDALLKKAGAR